MLHRRMAMEQTELLFNKNGTTTAANEAGRITINGISSTSNDINNILGYLVRKFVIFSKYVKTKHVIAERWKPPARAINDIPLILLLYNSTKAQYTKATAVHCLMPFIWLLKNVDTVTTRK